MTVTLPSLTLVIGGAASGKSDFAERLVTATRRDMIYVATAQAFDDEMREKINLHKQRRGAKWRTAEAPTDLAPVLSDAKADDIVLLDCATMWLTNQLLSDADLPKAQAALFEALQNCAAPVVVVSNEVGAGIVPENALARRFRQTQGELNQALAARAELVVTVIAGLPLILKGSLPEGAG